MKVKGTTGKISRQLTFALLLAVCGTTLEMLPAVKVLLGDSYGLILVCISIVVAVLRKITKGELQ